ncbi:acetyl-CoA carboxylase, biotin carboxyl carrier protein [Amylibacter sp.]|jgi:acetyl-CoA carboxylase biotin carboxyl carrier protein|nr:acetyl-CoA carboxylase, biotin carboxyl carrier protein [Amylibacter sp.]MDA9004757.1 acetyl-CoA carboxylase, biotin carboxyl carrier protein [Amylibacter sp.]MDA9074647.1 acetyl-CoA carboxylase, biotin carboxyl carrier protein [Amylibacter sp.]MDA9926408.1 acetyl-CoA carboxylase, biotin carboxyl carrier protein [Amylibacter sp.]MDB2320639.1 acetyl-CoA carboxylase, biotin carboxyl carrier protein [Amylibacter sp.]|tara:strand:+ start:948 stop:1445 length:498 start_codon:yes stop_codon:yes gene_type:complete
MTKKDQDTDVKFIQALAEVLTINDLAEVRVKREYGADSTLDVRVTRAFAPSSSHISTISQPQTLAPVPSAIQETPLIDNSSSDDPASLVGAVSSPMVGTVYLQAEPGSNPFISVGDKISEGQTILIIEAMKTMNQIPAPKSGKVARILVDDGTPVEFGTPLIIIE